MVLAKDKYSLNVATENILKTALETVQGDLQIFADDSDFTGKMQLAFGDWINIIDLQKAWRSGDFSSFPLIEILPANEINQANGAFAAATNTIYLAQEFLSQNVENPDAIIDVLLEEIGHSVDALLNASDSPGDEGAIFSALVQREILDGYQLEQLKAEDDTAIASLDGQLIEIEQATTGFVSGGFEGSSQILKLDSKGGGTANYFYEMYFIPDQFILRYEGKEILNTGFVSGSKTGQVQIPQGNSDELEVILATNDEGTAWDYSVTTEDCADTTPFLIELAGGEFEDTDGDGDCEGQGTVYIGRTDGIARMLRVDGADVEFDDKQLRVLDGTIFSLIGSIPEPLFTGNFVLDFGSGTTSSLTDIKQPNQFQFGDLVDIDFNGLSIKPNKVALTGDFSLPLDLGKVGIQLDGTPNSLIIDENGASFGGAKVSFPRQEFRFLEETFPPGLFQVEAKDLSLEYIGADDQLKIQGQLTLKDPITKDENGNFALRNTEVVFDFVGNNFIGIKNGKVDVVGSASVKNIELPGGWGLDELSVSIDTVNQEVIGKTRISFPFPARSPIPPKSASSLGLKVGFLLPPPNIRVDSVSADVDNLNIAIGTTGFFFQRVAGTVSNISKEDPIRFGGGIGFSYGPVVTIPVAQLAQDVLGLPSSVDAAVVNVKLDIESDFQSSITGSGELSIVSPQLIKLSGTTEYNWDKDFAKGNGSLDVIGGLVSGTAQGRLDIDRGNFDGFGNVALKIPDVKLFGFFRDKTLASANSQIQYRDDSSTKNDFINTWGKINLGKINLPIFGEINLGVIDAGIRYYYLEGNVESLGNKLPLINSWNVAPDSEWVLMGVDWDIANNNVKLRVIDPDGNIYEESQFADNGIAIVDGLTDNKTRTVVVGRPSAGIWDIEVVDETGLGEVNYSAFGATDVPEVNLLTPDTDTSGIVDISFEAFDSDSNAKVSLFYDDDNTGFDGAFIDELTENDGLSNFQWNTQGIATGEYFIYAMAMDDGGIPVFSNYSLGKVIVSEEADLSVTQTASTDSVGIGENFTYTVTVTNNGLIESKGVKLTETLPEEVTFVSASTALLQQLDNTLTFDLDNLASGASKTIEITVTAPLAEGNITGSAFVASDTFDPDATNDVDILTTTVEEIPPEPVNLSISRTDSPNPINLGENFTYTLTIANNGSGDATGVVVTENLPAGVNFVDVTTSQGNAFQDFDGKVIANLDSIKSGEDTTITITVQPFTAGNLIGTTSVASNETELDITDNFLIKAQAVNSVIPANADLELTQTVDNPNPKVDDQVSLTITLTNKGPGTASSIEVTELLPAGLSFVSAIPEQGTYDSSTGVWNVGNIRDNLSRTLNIIANVETTGAITTTAQITAVRETDPDSVPNNNNPNEDDQASITLNSANSVSSSLTKNDTNIFTIEGSSGTAH
ncbi:MAG: DUF11 domain-containing protein [Richelia sp. RM2_1_2]|nr:DUF11 domain-containing protein [Richelia sp. RM2_1_2]